MSDVDAAKLRKKLHEEFVKAWKDGNPDEALVRAYYTADCKRFPPNAATVTGREDAVKSVMDMATGANKLQVEVQEVEVRGDLAYVITNFTLAKGDGTDLTGRALEIYKKEGEEWYLYREMFNSNK